MTIPTSSNVGPRRLTAGLLTAVLSLIASFGCEQKPREVVVSETRVQIVEETVGHGQTVTKNDVICIDYVVRIEDTGEQLLRGDDYCFRVGRNTMVEGLDQGVIGMKAHGRRVIRVPPHKHWGRAGYAGGKIPPRTTLLFDVELTSVDPGDSMDY